MTQHDRRRKIAALQRLAERPGTPAEGAAARAALDRLSASADQGTPTLDSFDVIDEILRQANWSDDHWFDITDVAEKLGRSARKAEDEMVFRMFSQWTDDSPK